MKLVVLVWFSVLTTFLFGGGMSMAMGDCNVPTIYQGVTQVEITKLVPLRPGYLAANLTVLTNFDFLVEGMNPGHPRALTVKKLDPPFFKGSHQGVPLVCNGKWCDEWLKVDFKREKLVAAALLVADCPDASQLDFMEILESRYAAGTPLGPIPLVTREKLP
jgi:hypothetical protein